MEDSEAPPRLAAIDVGTDSIRLVVAEVDSAASYRVLDAERAQTRLGQGLYHHLIMHADFPGFSAAEVEIIANVARYHRRAHPRRKHPNFARLDPVDRQRVRMLSALLRLAAGLDRTHTPAVTGVRAGARATAWFWRCRQTPTPRSKSGTPCERRNCSKKCSA